MARSDDGVTDERIQPALHALLSGDATGLDSALQDDPGLVNAVWNNHTLLEWATQPPHGVEATVVDVLINRGAHLDRALGLAGCWNLADLCQQLLDAGADPASRADADITPLESAAMHGSTDAADVLVHHGLHRPALWLAAASGQTEMVESWVDVHGTLLKPVGEYRPKWADVGRPSGAEPSNDPAEIIGEALVLAAANGRIETVAYLSAAGADLNSRPYQNTTGLHLAVQFRKPDMVRYLVDAGASTAIRDDQYNGDAQGWARACDDGSPEANEILSILS